jgi:four helix bundle protein
MGHTGHENLKQRTKQFALRVLKLTTALPRHAEANAIRGQLVRSATSVGANYRAACRARSNAEFVAKIGVVEEEADESCFWIELIVEAGFMRTAKVAALLDEGNQLVAIMASSRKTAKS